MSEDWRAKAVPQSVEVKPPEITAPPAEALSEEKTRGLEDDFKGIREARKRPAKPSRPSKIAVLALHGMGQQIQFETLDQVQRNFCAAAERQGVKLPKPGVQVARLNGEVMRRAEVRLGEEKGAPEVHFYESYWAPLTEGRVGLRDVISFLRSGGWNGLQHCIRPSSSRYMFGEEVPLPRSGRYAVYLTLALLAVSALVMINTIVLAVAAATNWLGGGSSGWLTPLLLEDLTGVASAVCLVGAVLLSGLLLSTMRRELEGRPWRLPADRRFILDSLFYLTLITLTGVAGALILLVKSHSSSRPLESLLFIVAGGKERAMQIATVLTSAILLSLLTVVAGMLVKAALGKRLPSLARLVVGLAFYLPVACLAGAGGFLIAILLGANVSFFSVSELFWPLDWLLANRNLWVWSVLIALSAFARSFLVQYLGDVAAYVSPHKLDRFNEIRDQIKKEVLKTARAVYSRSADGSPEYDRIAVVGHSLGSVVAYDTLNCLINEDLLSGSTSDVADRTCLFLTFGSPLDKIAYLFQIQGSRTSDTREALANAVQPLIRNYDHRTFPWINVFSKDDIICGSLELFDDGKGHPRSVHNKEDRYSSIPLVAHTEYWRTPLVWDELFRIVDSEWKSGAQAASQPVEEQQREAG
ncbi:MAG TPA: hypothetical protein VEL74_09440 [Thermoanaerobaculia bacterium]|nr:hypothetical protein [Thermoanaerobaculia bacterium]